MCVHRRFGIAFLLGMMIVAPTVRAGDVDMRLRLTWGEGRVHAWRGRVTLSAGEITAAQRLAFEADSAGSTTRSGGQVRFWQRSASAFDGLDISLEAPEDAVLKIELEAPATGQPIRKFEMLLSEFRNNRTYFQTSPLDDEGNRLVTRRAPGDRLRVQFEHDSLVFSPGERFTFSVRPADLALPAGTATRCDMQLVRAETGEEQWRQHTDLEVAAGGATPLVGPLSVTLPDVEGVYDLLISLSEWKFLRYYVVLQRKVQLVVVDGSPRVAATVPRSAVLGGGWKDVDEVELNNPNWWARWNPLPLPRVAGAKPGPLGKEHLRERDRDGQRLTELTDWVAAPLPIARVGQPHVLEIEYPGDIAQTLGVSIVEPNAAGDVRPIGLDSGFDVPSHPRAGTGQLETHRLVFWPRTRSPWMVLTNRRQDSPAVFGRIRVRAGPAELPSSANDAAAVSSGDGRLLAAYYDRPLFPENFSAPDALDPPTGRNLHDWMRFYTGGRRLIEYLKYAGYNGAVISVAREGGAIYPSRLLEPNLRYDNGPLFFTGQDPRRKDILEMLFRMFDREGLTLVPAVQFATPLPALERQVAEQEDVANGIEMIEVDAAGNPHLGRHRARRGLGPYYNPLDPRVQSAMLAVAAEIAGRYASHPSFGGLGVQLNADGYTQLPGVSWALDDGTMGRFANETGIEVPGEGADRFVQRAEFVQSSGREPWLQWRAGQLADFYRRLQQQLAAQRPQAKLYLASADLLNGWSVRYEMRPRLLQRGDFAAAMQRHGLAASEFADDPGIVLLRTQRLAPLSPVAAQALNLAVRHDAEVDTYFAGARQAGTLNYHESQGMRLTEFEAVSPFGAERTLLRMETHVSPSGIHNRARFAHNLARLDAMAIVDGGWMPPLGQEEAVRDLFAVYRSLPAVPFTEVASNSASSSPVIVRTAQNDGRSFVYAVNDSPWKVVLSLDFAQGCTVRPLGLNRAGSITVPDGEAWTVAIGPYELVAAAIDPPASRVEDWQVRVVGDAEEVLRESIRDVAARINQLRNPEPMGVLQNPDFEIAADEDGMLPGWQYAQRDGVSVKAVRGARDTGGRALHMHVAAEDGVAWIRSGRFPLPTSGRVTIQALVRTRSASRQPPLRFAVDLLVDGRLERKEFDPYRYAPLGVDVDRQGRATGKSVPAIPDTWSAAPFVAQIDDLPVGGPTEMTIGFDLMGPGDVWIDEVRVYDNYFQVNEQRELLKNVATANSQLDRGKLIECARYLDGYWPRFLIEQTPPPARVARVQPAATVPRQPPPPAEKPSAWERFTPKLRFPSLPFTRDDD